jgi:hypothetical protein
MVEGYFPLLGKLKLSLGTYAHTATGTTGGEIGSGLSRVLVGFVYPMGAIAPANMPVIDETLPATAQSMTVVTENIATRGVYLLLGQG